MSSKAVQIIVQALWSVQSRLFCLNCFFFLATLYTNAIFHSIPYLRKGAEFCIFTFRCLFWFCFVFKHMYLDFYFQYRIWILLPPVMAWGICLPYRDRNDEQAMQKLAHCNAWTAGSLTCAAPAVETHFSNARLLLWAQPFPHRGMLGTFLRAARRHAQRDWRHLRRTRRCGCAAVVMPCEGAVALRVCFIAPLQRYCEHPDTSWLLPGRRHWATWTWVLCSQEKQAASEMKACKGPGHALHCILSVLVSVKGHSVF